MVFSVRFELTNPYWGYSVWDCCVYHFRHGNVFDIPCKDNQKHGISWLNQGVLYIYDTQCVCPALARRNGAHIGTWTRNRPVMSRMLYQLSYASMLMKRFAVKRFFFVLCLNIQSFFKSTYKLSTNTTEIIIKRKLKSKSQFGLPFGFVSND